MSMYLSSLSQIPHYVHSFLLFALGIIPYSLLIDECNNVRTAFRSRRRSLQVPIVFYGAKYSTALVS